MNFSEFTEINDGVYLSYFGLKQCVALWRNYCEFVLNIEQAPKVKSAYQIWEQYQKYAFTRHGLGDGLPQKGDTIIWNQQVGNGNGHIAIYIDGDKNSFRALSQNWPIGSPVHIQTFNWNNVLGYLTVKVDTPTTGATINSMEPVTIITQTPNDILYVRSAPNRKSRSIKKLANGTSVIVVGFTTGEIIDGNGTWWLLKEKEHGFLEMGDQWIWSGGTDHKELPPTIDYKKRYEALVEKLSKIQTISNEKMAWQ